MATSDPSLLLLGGTAWLGREIARQAHARGIAVTCLARGSSSVAPAGVEFVRADRSRHGAYAEVADRDWDFVLDVTWQPAQAHGAVEALAGRAAHWTYVSSISAYAEDSPAGQQEEAALHEPWPGPSADMEQYGPAKSACEAYVRNALGERGLIVRPGLIAGPGDPSDRFGYWVGRMALAGSEPVLIPDAAANWCQVIDVRDLAEWLLDAAHAGLTGAVNAVGESRRLGDVLALCAERAHFSGAMARATEAFLEDEKVEPWAGPRSLPLWLPAADAGFFGQAPDRRARDAGLRCRPLEGTIDDVLADERIRGLDRPRQAGLTWDEERALLGIMS